MVKCIFIVYFIYYGLIVCRDGEKWIVEVLMNMLILVLEQSWLCIKMYDLVSYMKVVEFKVNLLNNMLFVDDQGEMVFLMLQFVFKCDNCFDYIKFVDGFDLVIDWDGFILLYQLLQVVNLFNGWVFNINDWFYFVVGFNSLKQVDYLCYMDIFGENLCGLYVMCLFIGVKDVMCLLLISMVFDFYLLVFVCQLLVLIYDYDVLFVSDLLKVKLCGLIVLLCSWDYCWGIVLMLIMLVVFWGDMLWDEVSKVDIVEGLLIYDVMVEKVGLQQCLYVLVEVVDWLQQDFGYWGVLWGEVNCFQCFNGDIQQLFDDSKLSILVLFIFLCWGLLVLFGVYCWLGMKCYYGISGNSFVVVVEFGLKVSVCVIIVGGESGYLGLKYFNDEVECYIIGNLCEVYFWFEQFKGYIECSYYLGQ